MENCNDDVDVRLGYPKKESNGPPDVTDKIIRPRTHLPYYAGETEPRARPNTLEKHLKHNYPGFPERPYACTRNKVPDGCDSSFAAKYPYDDNQLHTEKTTEKTARWKRTRSTDYNGTQTYGEELMENIYGDPTAYRSNRNVSNALTSSSSSSESEPDWEEPPKETRSTKDKLSKQARKEITRRKVKQKSQATNSPSTCFQEKLSDNFESWSARDEALPENRKQSEIRTSTKHYGKQNNDSHDDIHESISHGIPYSYGSSPATCPSYHDQLYTANTSHVVTKFASNTESDDEEPKTHRMRRNSPSSSRVSNSISSCQQWPSKRPDRDTVKNRSEEEAESWCVKREVELKNQVSGIQNVSIQEEPSDDSDDNQPYRENTDRMVTKYTNTSEIDEDRQTEQGKIYEGLTTYRRRKNYFRSSGVAFKPDDSRQQHTPRGIILDIDLRKDIERKTKNWDTRKEMKLRNKNFSPRGDSLDYSDECKTRRNETFYDNKRSYWLGEVRRGQPSFREVEPNPTFFTKDEHMSHYFSQADYDAKGGRENCGNQNRNQPMKRKTEKAFKRCSCETGEERWVALESRHEALLSPDSDCVCDRPRNYQVQEKEIIFDLRNQDRKSFRDRNSRCGCEESIETTPVEYFKHGIQGEQFCSRQKLCGQRATHSCSESDDDVLEINNFFKSDFQGRGTSDGYSERPQQCQETHYQSKNLSAHGIPEFPCEYHLNSRNGLQELANYDKCREKQEPRQHVHYRSKNFGRCDHQKCLPHEIEDDSHVNFPNSNPQMSVKSSYRDGSDYYRREHVGMPSTSRNINQQYDKEEKSVSRPVREAERVSYQSYASMRSPYDEEEQINLSLKQMSIDSRSAHESNMCAVKDTIIADLKAFGSKLNDAIRSCHTSLQLFGATHEEWLKARDATLRMLRDFEADIRRNGDWKARFSGFCDFLKDAGGVAGQILNFTPYRMAVPVVRIAPLVIKKLGNAIMWLTNRNNKDDPELLNMFQVLQTDIEESSQLKMFALQCEMQFKETDELLIEFRDVLYGQQMADAIEDMGLLNFIIDFTDADPASDSFFRHISDAYRKFYNSGKDEPPSATRETFCSFINGDPSILETLQCIDWKFAKSFQNHTAENDLSVCWTSISTLVSSSDAKEAEEALSRIAMIIRILETQGNFVNTSASRLFKVV